MRLRNRKSKSKPNRLRKKRERAPCDARSQDFRRRGLVAASARSRRRLLRARRSASHRGFMSGGRRRHCGFLDDRCAGSNEHGRDQGREKNDKFFHSFVGWFQRRIESNRVVSRIRTEVFPAQVIGRLRRKKFLTLVQGPTSFIPQPGLEVFSK